MKLSTLSAAAIAASLMVVAGSADAMTYGVVHLGADDSFSFDSGTILANTPFSDTIIFTTTALSSSVDIFVGSEYTTGADKIQLFASLAKLPNGSTGNMGALQDDGSTQYYTNEFVNAPAGTYKLVVNGTTGASANHYGVSVNTNPVPEPETYALMASGLAFLAFVGKRRKSA